MSRGGLYGTSPFLENWGDTPPPLPLNKLGAQEEKTGTL